MKLNTLLLTSAATLMATSVAFAADLPSKKAAPAAGSVQVCKVGAVTGFTLPGSNTCFSISGRAVYEGAYDLDAIDEDGVQDYSQAASWRVGLDASTNTEIGAVRSFIRFDGTDSGDVSTSRAYVQFAGFTAGKLDSLADIAGTNPWAFGTGWAQNNVGLNYALSAGGIGFAVGIENSNASAGLGGDLPDVLAQVSGKAGPVGFKITGVSHEGLDAHLGTSDNGYALVGQMTASMGDVGLIVYGGMSEGASRFTGSKGSALDVDFVNGDAVEGSSIGAELNFKAGKTMFALSGRQNDHDWNGAEVVSTSYGVWVSHELAKGLTIQPEWVRSETETSGTVHGTNGTVESDTLYLTIERDF